MTSHAQIEATQSIAWQTVTSALQYDCSRLVPIHDWFDDGFEDIFVRRVVNAIAKGEIDGVVFSLTDTDVAQFTSPGEVFAILMEWNSHDSVCGVESFLDAIAMMYINVNVQHPLMEP